MENIAPGFVHPEGNTRSLEGGGGEGGARVCPPTHSRWVGCGSSPPLLPSSDLRGYWAFGGLVRTRYVCGSNQGIVGPPQDRSHWPLPQVLVKTTTRSYILTLSGKSFVFPVLCSTTLAAAERYPQREGIMIILRVRSVPVGIQDLTFRYLFC